MVDRTDAERVLGDTCRKDSLNSLGLLLAKEMFEAGLFRTCLNCEYWREGPSNSLVQICGKYNIRPPTKIIVMGCDDHSDNIPF